MNVEVREVADALNLPTSTIEAIEANAFEMLPNRVFARGYVRAYAKLVELEPDAIVAAFQSASEPHDQAQAGAPVVVQPMAAEPAELLARLGALRTRLEHHVQERPLQALGLVAASLTVLFLLLWLLLGAGSNKVEPPPRQQPAPANGQPAQATPAPGAQRGGFTELHDTAPTDADPASLPAVPADAVVQLGPGDDRLRFSFVADCWVEVRNVDDQVLYSDLGQSNKQLELTGKGPFRILLGYAPGARLVFNGENVVLTPHTRNDVARLVLGQ